MMTPSLFHHKADTTQRQVPTRIGGLLVDEDGKVWYTDAGGARLLLPAVGPPFTNVVFGSNNLVGRLTPTQEVFPTPTIETFPLPASTTKAGTLAIALAGDGDIVFSEPGDSALMRLERDMLASGACAQLDATGRNPCVREAVVPGFPKPPPPGGPTIDRFEEGVSGIGFDPSGNLWVAQTGTYGPNRLVSVGYVLPDWSKVIHLPPLSLFPGAAAFSGNGLTVAPNGDVYVADVLGIRVVRLRRVA